MILGLSGFDAGGIAPEGGLTLYGRLCPYFLRGRAR